MKQKLKTALVQYESVLCEPKRNADRAYDQVLEAAANGANFVCLPEMFNTGYNFDLIGKNFSALGETLAGYTVSRLSEAARKGNCHIVAPIVLEDDVPGVLYNAAVVIDDTGEVLGYYAKHHLWALERFYFRGGESFPVFQTKYGKIGVMICYDAGFPEAARILTLKGAELIFMPSAWRAEDRDIWNLNIPQRALENTVFIAAVNRFGKEGDLYMFGNSKVSDYRGRIIAESKVEKEDIAYADIDLSALKEARLQLPYLKDRTPESYDVICW